MIFARLSIYQHQTDFVFHKSVITSTHTYWHWEHICNAQKTNMSTQTCLINSICSWLSDTPIWKPTSWCDCIANLQRMQKIMEKRSPLSHQQQEASFYHDSNEVRLAVLSVWTHASTSPEISTSTSCRSSATYTSWLFMASTTYKLYLIMPKKNYTLLFFQRHFCTAFCWETLQGSPASVT